MFTLRDLPPRILSKIQVVDGCWIWTGARNNKGYGSVGVDGRSHLAHRYVYTLAYGAIPDGMTLDHMCEQVSCVHPYHLNPETSGDNTRLRFTRSLEPAPPYEPDPALTGMVATIQGYRERYAAMSADQRAAEDGRRHALHALIGCSCITNSSGSV